MCCGLLSLVLKKKSRDKGMEKSNRYGCSKLFFVNSKILCAGKEIIFVVLFVFVFKDLFNL